MNHKYSAVLTENNQYVDSTLTNDTTKWWMIM